LFVQFDTGWLAKGGNARLKGRDGGRRGSRGGELGVDQRGTCSISFFHAALLLPVERVRRGLRRLILVAGGVYWRFCCSVLGCGAWGGTLGTKVRSKKRKQLL